MTDQPVTAASPPRKGLGDGSPSKPAREDAKAAAVETAIEEACARLMALRGRPVLVLYYPDAGYPDAAGTMEEADVEECYAALRNGGVVHEHPLDQCDVLLHTAGGSPQAGYRLAQCIRDFARRVDFLVPVHAYSAGTLLCFSGNQIRLGHAAGLSPIDVTMVEEHQSGHDEIELASIDGFLQFADDCQRHQQTVLDRHEVDGISSVGSDLLCELVHQTGALRVGTYYRARTLTGHYAKELLERYMLTGQPNSEGRGKQIVSALLFAKPVHAFHIDYHLCLAAGLEVTEMNTEESDASKAIVSVLQEQQMKGRICPMVTDQIRMPFIAFYSNQGSR